MKTKFSFLAPTAKTALMLSAVAIVILIGLAVVYTVPAGAVVAPKPDLIIQQVEPNVTTVNAGEMLPVADTVQNQGLGDAKKFTVYYRLSDDPTYGNKGDIVIAGGLYRRTPLVPGPAAGASDVSPSFNIMIPIKTPPGDYYVCAKVSSSPGESDSKNNTLCSTGKVTVPPPDLIVSALSTATTTAKAGSVIRVSLSVMNQGGSSSKASKVGFHASLDSTYGGGDDVPLTAKPVIPALQRGKSRMIARQAVKMPSTPGTYFICANADADNVVSEGEETNNSLCTATQITVLDPAATTTSTTTIPASTTTTTTTSTTTTTLPAAINEWLLFAGDGTSASNHLNIFKASEIPPIETPIPPVPGSPVGYNTLSVGEIHFANGKTFVVISSNLDVVQGDGGIAVFNTETQASEGIVPLISSLKKSDGITHAASRIVHEYIDPEAKFVWAMNDGPSGDNAPDSAFRVNVDPASPDYLTYLEIPIGNGHHKAAFSRPNAAHPDVPRLVFTSDYSDNRSDVIDDDPASATYGQVIKIIRNEKPSPHGFDYSPASGRAFSGIIGGGVVSIDATQITPTNIANFPDVSCLGINNNYCFKTGSSPPQPDPSVYQMTTGPSGNPNLFAGFTVVKKHANGTDTVYTAGYSGSAHKGWLTAINPGSGSTPPSPVAAIDMGDMSPSSFNIGAGGSANKAYVPSGGIGVAITNQVRVVDVDNTSPIFNAILYSIAVGTHAGDERNGKISGDGRLALFPNSATNTVSVIDTDSDTVIDTLTLAASIAKNTGIVHLPANNPENYH